MNDKGAIKILCVDDHEVVREGLSAIIGTQSDMKVIAEAADGLSAFDRFCEHQPDLVLMDLSMPGLGGIESIAKIRGRFPDARIIVLTTFDGDENIYRALEAGASAYLLKSMIRKELLQAIREVRSGRRYIPAQVAAKIAQHTPRMTLTSRELDVLKLMATGLRNKEIGQKLGIAEDTVKIHAKGIFGKLCVSDRTEAVVMAMERGILPYPRSS